MKLISRHWSKMWRSHPGTKAVKIIRLLDIAGLRVELSTWGEYSNDHIKTYEIATGICALYKRTDLVTMAKRAKIFYSLPKRGIVIGLLQWRNRCRMRGKKFNDDLRRVAQIQYILPGLNRWSREG